jgi:hypothetical protein
VSFRVNPQNCHVPSPGLPEGLEGDKQASLQPPLLTRLLLVSSGGIMRPIMEKAAITAVLCGAILFGLGMFPGLIATLREGLENFRDHVSQTQGPIYRSQTDRRFSGDIWLLVGGGVMMIVGLLALLSR